MVEAGNHVEPAERLRRGQPSGLSDDGAVVVDAREGRNRLVRPAVVDDELAAIRCKRAQVRVGRVVNSAELFELLVHFGGERHGAQRELARGILQERHFVQDRPDRFPPRSCRRAQQRPPPA